jgi:hypothetical protein
MEATLDAFNRQLAVALLGTQPLDREQQVTSHEQAPLEVQVETTAGHLGGKGRHEEETEAVGGEEEDRRSHVLMPNMGGSRILCRLCSKRGLKTRSRYGCMQCRLGFHVECFAVFHNPSFFTGNVSGTVQDGLDAMRDTPATSRPFTRRRENHSVISVELVTLPSASDDQEM